MARRFSGALRISVTFVDEKNQYKVGITWTEPPGGRARRMTQWVRSPRVLTRPVDAPESYDDVSRAALAFAEEEESDVSRYAALTPEGFHVGRSPEQAWPTAPKSNK